MGKGVVTHDEARETLVITRKTSERLFDFAFRLAARRKSRGGKNLVHCVDKANMFRAFAFFREIFYERAATPQGRARRSRLCRRSLGAGWCAGRGTSTCW